MIPRAARRRVEAAWKELRATTDPTETFQPEAVSELPEPARRYLARAIAPGTPLYTAVELEMTGTIALRPGGAALPMEATQVSAWPRGYVWRARVGRRLLRISGFDLFRDGEAAMRWWLWGLVPVVRQEGPEVARSAAGRLASEAVLLPTVLLPRLGARWEAVDADRARVSVRVAGERLDLTLTLTPEGALRRTEFLRLHPEEEGDGLTPVPWRVDVLEERTFQGLTIPGRLRAVKAPGSPEEHDFILQDFRAARFR